MMKKLAIGLLAFAATGAIAFTAPATAFAATSATTTATTGSSDYDYSDNWGDYFSSNYKAKARGWINVDWDKYQKWNKVYVKGSLYDLDHRTYKQGGKCAYVKVAVHHFGDHRASGTTAGPTPTAGPAGPRSSSSPSTRWTASVSRSARSPGTATTRPGAGTGSTSTPQRASDHIYSLSPSPDRPVPFPGRAVRPFRAGPWLFA